MNVFGWLKLNKAWALFGERSWPWMQRWIDKLLRKETITMVQLGFIWFALPYHMKITALLHYNHILVNAIFHWFPMVRKYLIIYTFILILFSFLSSFLWEENYATLKEKSMGHCGEVCQENIEIIWVATQKLCWVNVKSAMDPYCRQNKSTVCFFFFFLSEKKMYDAKFFVWAAPRFVCSSPDTSWWPHTTWLGDWAVREKSSRQ